MRVKKIMRDSKSENITELLNNTDPNIRIVDKLSFKAIRYLEHFLGRKFGKKELVRNILHSLNERNKKSILKSMEHSDAGSFIDIEEVDYISPEDFKKNYLDKGIPLVIRNAAKDWDCYSKWTPEFFGENYGDDEIVLTEDHIATDDSALGRITLREIVDNLDDGDIAKYARFVPILSYHPELFQDFDTQWLAERIDKNNKLKLWGEKGPGTSLRSHLFLGRKGAKTEVHCALTNNMFINVYGRKQWHLISPKYDPMMYSPVNWGPGLYGTELSPEASDFEKYPLQKYISGYKFVLEPGDILFNPPFWWHHVKNLTHCISIGMRWYSFSNAMKVSKTQNTLALLATNPSLSKAAKNSVEYWKHLEKYQKEEVIK